MLVPYEKTIGLFISCITYITAGKICSKMAGMKIGTSRCRLCQHYRTGMPHRWYESRVRSTQACQRNQLNLLRMLIVDACPTPHRRLADGLAALTFHPCLSGTFGRWALSRMFQNETKPVLKTVKVSPYVQCLIKKDLAIVHSLNKAGFENC
jgi:hypothetical protein